MGLWDRIRRWSEGGEGEAGAGVPSEPEPERPAERPPQRRAPAPEAARLAELGLAGGPTPLEAIAILRRVRGTLEEAEAVAAVQRAAPRLGGLPGAEAVRVAAADLLATRGDEAAARRLLEGATSTEGLVLSADLHAAGGQLARAVVTIERVLARDLDAPGAMERFRRWRASLGAVPVPVRRVDEATVVAAAPSGHAFRLLREVARGGAGVVYEAEDELLGRRVAFKVYHGRGEDRAVLLREVRSAQSLAGPGVVRVFDADPDAGWVAFEWAPRGSLREALRAGDLASLLPISKWATPLARALARVHGAGFVHADVKPANVLLRSPRDPVLADFGIARRPGAKGEGGSPGYVSPERLAGEPSDPRDDVYGFGRVIEDAVVRAGELLARAGRDGAALDPFRELAERCMAERARRPADGAALLSALGSDLSPDLASDVAGGLPD